MKKYTRVFAVLLAMVMLLTTFPMQAEAAIVKLNKTKVTIYIGKTTTLKITGTSKKATWSSDNKKIATVSSKGLVTAKKEGVARITAKVGQKSYWCSVTVRKPYINATNKKVGKGYTCNLELVGTEIKSAKSSNTKVATVTKKGKVTGKKVGTATITLTGKNGKSYKCKIKVVKKAPQISKESKVLVKNETYDLKLYGTGIKSVKSSDKNVATVTKKGKVTAKAVGEATITLKGEDNKSYTCKIIVKKKRSSKDIPKWTGGNITLGNFGVTIPTLNEFNNVGLDSKDNWWYGPEYDKDSLSSMNRVYLTCSEIGKALADQTGSTQSVNAFCVSKNIIWWSWNDASSEHFTLERLASSGYYKLSINRSMKDDPYGDRQLAPWNKDVVKTMISFISSEPELVFDTIYEDFHGEECISDTSWTTVGDCKIKYAGSRAYYIKAK